MIKQFSLENYLSFKKAQIEFKNGLIVFSGASGSGKSILMNSILDVFSLKSTDAERLEAIVEVPLQLDDFGIESNEDENYFSKNKKDKTRFFINSQIIPKKKVQEISSSFLRYLHLKDYSDFENSQLISLLDTIVCSKSSEHELLLIDFKQNFNLKSTLSKKLTKIIEEEKNIEDLKEFAEFEINKIETLSPTEEEDEELFAIKQRLSKKDSIEEQLEKCQAFFDYEGEAFKLLTLLNKDDSFLSDAISEFRNIVESEMDNMEDLENYDIEEVLDKIEAYGALKRKYGSVSEALAYKAEKEKELEHYNNLSFEKTSLEKELLDLEKIEKDLNNKISKNRQKHLPIFVKNMNDYLKMLYISNFSIDLEKDDNMTSYGNDRFNMKLKNADLNKISTGEFNRLRLGLLALQTEYNDKTGILMLDEIDSNLSGEESMSVAKVLKVLSKKYQIFAISHLPQLTASADQHFLIYKDNEESKVKEIIADDRTKEIARLISGKDITDEAMSFANKFIAENQ